MKQISAHDQFRKTDQVTVNVILERDKSTYRKKQKYIHLKLIEKIRIYRIDKLTNISYITF